MSHAEDTQHPQRTLVLVPQQGIHNAPALRRTNTTSSVASQRTRVEGLEEVRSIPGPGSTRTSSSDHILYPRGHFAVFEAPFSSSSSSSSSEPPNTPDLYLDRPGVAGSATYRLLFNIAVRRPPLAEIEGAELEFLRARAQILGYQNYLDIESTELPALPVLPRPNDPIPVNDLLPSTAGSSPPIQAVPNESHSGSESEPPHSIHRPPTPYPGTRPAHPIATESDSNQSYPNTSLPDLPRLFHDWLTNPADHARTLDAIGRCDHDRVRSSALRYIELTTAIRKQRDELRGWEDLIYDAEQLLGALEWDRHSVAATLLGLRAESHLFPHTDSLGRPPIPTKPAPESRSSFPSSHDTASSYHTAAVSIAISTTGLPDRDHLTPSPPDGSSGYAFPGAVGSGFPVHQPRVRHAHPNAETNEQPSAGPSNQAAHGSTSSGEEPTDRRSWNHMGPGPSRNRRRPGRCWNCGSKHHWHRECHRRRERKSMSRRQDDIDAAIDELLESVRSSD